MVKKYAYICLLLSVVFVQINSKPDNVSQEEYSKTAPLTQLDTDFIEAVKENRLEDVQRLLQEGANVETPIPYVWTEADCDWFIESTALLYAIRYNRPKLVKVLLKAKGLDKALNVNDTNIERSLNKNEGLLVAIEEGRLAVVEEFIKGGANINYVDNDGNSPLMKAIRNINSFFEVFKNGQISYDSELIIEALLKAGASVTHVNKFGRTALMQAVTLTDLHTVKALLKIPEMTTGKFFGLGTKPINYADEDGNTALILAVKGIKYEYINSEGYNICVNSQEIVKELLNTPGINLYHVNKKGDTAITLLEKVQKKSRILA